MKEGTITDVGTYIMAECPECKASNTLYYGFNPDDCGGDPEDEESVTCEKCKKDFWINCGE